MSQPKNNTNQGVSLLSAAVTDRGLNPKRPLNEDSFLADSSRGIFVVADGVGGAEAGEVASQTAIEILDDAFRNQAEDVDIEDLLELAIQRANTSIHQMALENSKFSMMATTVVGLHLKGNIATIGHVGDSRLYRLTPAGQLLRETDDHSVVEEEVRAGRMTAEQAANHPSKNVISRALGADDGVEVDTKVIEVDNGTQFLLCTDGITRHIPDHELQQVLVAHEDLTVACAELKQRCFDRGAEDNLTAILVCVGRPISAAQRLEDADKTITPDPQTMPTSPSLTADFDANQTMMGARDSAILTPASRKAFPALAAEDARLERTLEMPLNIGSPPSTKSAGERVMTRLFLFLLVICAVAGAFYAGRKYRGPIPYLDQAETAVAEATPTPTTTEDPLLKFAEARRTVDSNPSLWLSQLGNQGVQNPMDSSDPEFLYLYGRASLLTGNYEEARRAFESAIGKAAVNPTPGNAMIRKDAALGLAAVALKSEKDRPAALTRFDEVMTNPSSPGGSPSSSPAISPGGTP